MKVWGGLGIVGKEKNNFIREVIEVGFSNWLDMGEKDKRSIKDKLDFNFG